MIKQRFCCTKCYLMFKFIIVIVKLVHEDTDISDMSLKCLSLVVQLYGAETSGTLTAAHLVRFQLYVKFVTSSLTNTSCTVIIT